MPMTLTMTLWMLRRYNNGCDLNLGKKRRGGSARDLEKRLGANIRTPCWSDYHHRSSWILSAGARCCGRSAPSQKVNASPWYQALPARTQEASLLDRCESDCDNVRAHGPLCQWHIDACPFSRWLMCVTAVLPFAGGVATVSHVQLAEHCATQGRARDRHLTSVLKLLLRLLLIKRASVV